MSSIRSFIFIPSLCRYQVKLGQSHIHGRPLLKFIYFSKIFLCSEITSRTFFHVIPRDILPYSRINTIFCQTEQLSSTGIHQQSVRRATSPLPIKSRSCNRCIETRLSIQMQCQHIRSQRNHIRVHHITFLCHPISVSVNPSLIFRNR